METIDNISATPTNLGVLSKINELVAGHNQAVEAFSEVSTSLDNKLDVTSSTFNSITINDLTISKAANNRLQVGDTQIMLAGDQAESALKDGQGNTISSTYMLASAAENFYARGDTVAKATNDANGDNIAETYLKQADGTAYAAYRDGDGDVISEKYLTIAAATDDYLTQTAAEEGYLAADGTAAKATADAAGNVITTTYLRADAMAASAKKDDQNRIISETYLTANDNIATATSATYDALGNQIDTYYLSATGTAAKALADENGDNIVETYLNKDNAALTYLTQAAATIGYLPLHATADAATTDSEGNIIVETYIKCDRGTDSLDQPTAVLNVPLVDGESELPSSLFYNGKRLLTEDDALGEVDLSNTYLPVDATALKAIADDDGKVIKTTYVKIADFPTILAENLPEGSGESSGGSGGVSSEDIEPYIANLMPKIPDAVEIPNVIVNVAADGSITNSTTTIGTVNKPIYINNGSPSEITTNIPTNCLPSIVDGVLGQSNRSVGTAYQPIYIDEGQFKVCNEFSASSSGDNSYNAPQTVLQQYNIKGDGITDNTDALQLLINDSSVSEILLTEGIYIINGPLICSSALTIKGQNAIVKQMSAGYNTFDVQSSNIVFEDITFELDQVSSTSTRDTDIAIKLTNGSNLQVKNCTFKNYSTAVANGVVSGDIYVTNCVFDSYFRAVNISQFSKCVVQNCIGRNPKLDQYTTEAIASGDPSTYSLGQRYDSPHLVYAINGNNLWIDGCSDTNTYSAIAYLSGCNNSAFTNNCSTGGVGLIHARICDNLNIKDNVFMNQGTPTSLGEDSPENIIVKLLSCTNSDISNNKISTTSLRAVHIGLIPGIIVTKTDSDTGYSIETDETITVPEGISYTDAIVSFTVGAISPSYSQLYTATLIDANGEVETFTTEYTIEAISDGLNRPSHAINLTNNSITTVSSPDLVRIVGSTNIKTAGNQFRASATAYQCKFIGCSIAKTESYFSTEDLHSNYDIKCIGITTEIPTKVSQLTNDAGYITQQALTNYYTKTEADTAFMPNMDIRLCLYYDENAESIIPGLDTVTGDKLTEVTFSGGGNPMNNNYYDNSSYAAYCELSTGTFSAQTVWKPLCSDLLESGRVALFMKVGVIPQQEDEPSGNDDSDPIIDPVSDSGSDPVTP